MLKLIRLFIIKDNAMEIFKSWLVERFIAHRGLHDEANPENSLGAFQNAINNDHPIELDVHLISDGTVVVFHDSTLSRLTGKDRKGQIN